MADELTVFNRIKQYLGSDAPKAGTWRVDLSPGVPIAITLGNLSTPVNNVYNRHVSLSIRKDDVLDLIKNKLNTITAKPDRLDPAALEGTELVTWTFILRQG